MGTINECKALKVFTRKQALLYMCKRSKRAKYAELEQRKTTKAPEDEAMEMLSYLILSHVPCEAFQLGNKIAYVAVMLRRMMYALLDPGFLDDRDYYGNKRLDLAGPEAGWVVFRSDSSLGGRARACGLRGGELGASWTVLMGGSAQAGSSRCCSRTC